MESAPPPDRRQRVLSGDGAAHIPTDGSDGQRSGGVELYEELLERVTLFLYFSDFDTL